MATIKCSSCTGSYNSWEKIDMGKTSLEKGRTCLIKLYYKVTYKKAIESLTNTTHKDTHTIKASFTLTYNKNKKSYTISNVNFLDLDDITKYNIKKNGEWVEKWTTSSLKTIITGRLKKLLAGSSSFKKTFTSSTTSDDDDDDTSTSDDDDDDTSTSSSGSSSSSSSSSDSSDSSSSSSDDDIDENFHIYDLSDSQLKQLACAAEAEQGNLIGRKWEMCLMANLAESKGKTANIVNYVKNGGWFASATTSKMSGTPASETLEAARDIFNKGHRIIPVYINEHDCLSDFSWVAYDGVNQSINFKQYSSYKKDITLIHNKYSSEWTFYGFPGGDYSNNDPFGYTTPKVNGGSDYVWTGSSSSSSTTEDDSVGKPAQAFDLIAAAIGEVTIFSETAIGAARDCYSDLLTETEQGKTTKYSLLTTAESTWEKTYKPVVDAFNNLITYEVMPETDKTFWMNHYLDDKWLKNLFIKIGSVEYSTEIDIYVTNLEEALIKYNLAILSGIDVDYWLTTAPTIEGLSSLLVKGGKLLEANAFSALRTINSLCTTLGWSETIVNKFLEDGYVQLEIISDILNTLKTYSFSSESLFGGDKESFPVTYEQYDPNSTSDYSESDVYYHGLYNYLVYLYLFGAITKEQYVSATSSIPNENETLQEIFHDICYHIILNGQIYDEAQFDHMDSLTTDLTDLTDLTAGTMLIPITATNNKDQVIEFSGNSNLGTCFDAYIDGTKYNVSSFTCSIYSNSYSGTAPNYTLKVTQKGLSCIYPNMDIYTDGTTNLNKEDNTDRVASINIPNNLSRKSAAIDSDELNIITNQSILPDKDLYEDESRGLEIEINNTNKTVTFYPVCYAKYDTTIVDTEEDLPDLYAPNQIPIDPVNDPAGELGFTEYTYPLKSFLLNRTTLTINGEFTTTGATYEYEDNTYATNFKSKTLATKLSIGYREDDGYFLIIDGFEYKNKCFLSSSGGDCLLSNTPYTHCAAQFGTAKYFTDVYDPTYNVIYKGSQLTSPNSDASYEAYSGNSSSKGYHIYIKPKQNFTITISTTGTTDTPVYYLGISRKYYSALPHSGHGTVIEEDYNLY